MKKKTNVKVCSNEFEHQYWSQHKSLLGIDEAGRGPLAGPLCVAGVMFEEGYENPLIYDSKGLSEKKRDMLYDMIIEDAKAFMIVFVSEEDIDRYNIYRADQMAMLEIAQCLQPDVVITDAMPIAYDGIVHDVVKGDQKSISVAAASILAKVSRDRLMVEYDAIYPQYGFAKHKGYGTKMHMQAIETYGITPIHRKSFKPVQGKQMCLNLFNEE